jgi:hypothetical protein
MNGDMEILLFLIVYLLVGYIIVRLVRKAVTRYSIFWQLTIKSFFYAMIFGINIIASGGDPGFAFPAPNLISFVFMWDFILAGDYFTIEIFVYWWGVLLVIMLIRNFFNRRTEKETQIIEQS